MDMLQLMAAPAAECLILVAIHTYLGIHVLRRRVIFVDLALAQTAALGTTVGFLFGIAPETPAALVFSMTFTFLAAAVFALTRIRGDRVPQEAVIGLFYALAAAVAVLVVQKTQGAEHLDSILVGSILWVKWTDVLTALVAYAVVGLVHFLLRDRFFLISERPDEAYRRGLNVRFWDFVFYLTFGFVISFSVRVAGVLLVFVFLVAPAIMAFMITDRLKHQLVIGWSMGTVVTVVGLYLSYVIDVPSGPTVIAFYGVVLALGALVLYVVRARAKGRALGWVGLGVVVAGLVVGAVYAEGRLLASTSLADDLELEHVAEELEHAAEETEHAVERAESAKLVALRGVVGDAVPAPRLGEYIHLDEATGRLEFIRAEIERDPRTGLPLVLCFLKNPDHGFFFRAEALAIVREHTGDDFGYDPEATVEENAEALAEMRAAILERPTR